MITIAPESIDIGILPSIKFGIWYTLPKIAAVYFCLNAEGQVLYVGQSTNLRNRWGNCHEKRSECIALKTTKLAWLQVELDELYDLESQMIARFDPILNYPPGFKGLRARIERRREIAEMINKLARL